MKYIISIFLFLQITGVVFTQNTQKIDSLKNELKYKKNKASIFNELAFSYITVVPEEALKYAKMALSEAKKENNKLQLGEALRVCALAYQYLNEYERSITLTDSAITIFQEIKNNKSIVQCLELKASTYLLQGNYNEALKLLHTGAEETKQIDDLYTYCAFIIQIGRVHMMRGNFNEALANFEKAGKIASEINDQYLMGHIYHFTGITYQDQQKFELAIENYLKALPIFEKENIITQIPYLLVSLGTALKNTKNYEEALRYYNDALKYYQNSKDRWGLNELYNYIGSAYLEMKNLDSAGIYFNKSLYLSKEIEEKSAECRALYKIGEILTTQHNYNKALEYLNNALELNVDIENDYYQVNILYNLGTCYSQKGNINKGLDLLQEGLSLADSLNFKYERMILNKEISNVYTELGNYKKALQYFTLYSDLNDSIYQEKVNKNMVEMEQKYQSQKQKTELSQLKLNSIEQEIAIRKQKSVRNIFIFGFLLAVLLGILFFRSYRLKKKANSEKEVLLKEIHHRVKNNLQVISSLLNIQSEYITDNKVIGAVNESQSRVKAMALIHQLLYQEKNLTKIDFTEYLKELSSTLASIFQKPDTRVNVEIEASHANFDIEISIPLGLIVTELVSNAYKYAFEGISEGKINIKLQTATKNKYVLVISDNGRGLPPNTDIYNMSSLGLKLVNILTSQLDGQFSYQYNKGARFMVEFSDIL